MKVKSSIKYTELSYIESTGTQYIDTGFVPNQDTRVVLKYGGANTSDWAEVLGAGTAVKNPSQNFVVVQSSSGGTQFQYGSEYANGAVTADGAIVDMNKNNFYINGSLVHTYTYTSFTSPYPLRLFDAATQSADYSTYSGKIYSCKIYNNGTLVRDYTPVLDNNNVVCLFDKVNSEFVYNAGTGSFIAGEIIQKVATSVWKDGQECYVKTNDNTWKVAQSVYVKAIEDLTVLDYIETTGNQYIDTGVKIKSTIVAQCKFTLTDLTNGGILGYMGDGSSRFGLFQYNGAWFLDLGSDANRVSGGTFSKDQLYNIEMGNRYVKNLDTDTNIISGATLSAFDMDSNFYMCGESGTGIGKWYYLKIFDDGILLRDYVPVLDSSGIACLYDKVTKQCYYNAGTGIFTVGGYIDTIQRHYWKQVA